MDATARPPRPPTRRRSRAGAGTGILCAGLRAVALVAGLVATLLAPLAQAAPMPGGGRPVTVTAREQPIAAFLQDLFASVGVPASIAPGLTGTVNGSFSGPADKVLRDIARVYNLVPYYDGSVMHVVPAADLARRTYAVAPAASDRLLREVGDLNLADAHNRLSRSADGSMVATGTRRFIEQLDDLLRAAQAQQSAPPASPSTADFRVFYLRYAWAQDVTMTVGGRQIVVPGVASILRSLVDGRSTGLGREVLLKPTQPSLKGQGLAGQGVSPVTAKPTAGEAARDAAVDTLVTALARTATPEESRSPGTTEPDPNQIRIEADPRLNAVIVRDTAERLPRYEQLIASLDVEPQSLEIEATIIDVNTDKLRELGINWRWDNDGRSAGFGGAVSSVGNGGIASIVLGSVGQFFARIRALQNEGAARIVSSPQVVTLSNVEAVFDNSSTFFVRVAGREQVDLFNVSAGTSLRVTPHVFPDRDATRIKLLVNVEDGNITGRQVDQIPVVERSSINTQALIAEGESLLIGGMVREVHSNSEDKVPGLGDVPVVGNLFKTRSSQSARIERMFLITPRLAGSRGTPKQGTAAPVAASPLTSAAAPAAGPAAAPLPAAPVVPARASVELDLDAMPAAPSPVPAQRPAAPPGAVPLRVIAHE